MKTITRPTSKWLPVLILSIYQLQFATGQTIYVDANATGANNGTNWTDAYTGLQSAINNANSDDEIWVTKGTYKPSYDYGLVAVPPDSQSRLKHFRLKNGVAIYGGFSGIETILEQRDWQANKTILSGNIGAPSNRCYHVFYHPNGTNLDSSAILDGFTISDGNANGSQATTSAGGGIYDCNNSPTITNCTFSNNSGYNGCGMFNYIYSNPTVTNCTFSGNSANGIMGGGMGNQQHSSPTVTNCTFNGNSVSGSGGGGGGLCNIDYSSPKMRDCNFSNNWVGNGMGCIGGGIADGNNSNPTITNCNFSNNWAGSGSGSRSGSGGGISNNTSSPTITNCTFSGNGAYNGDGGGIYNYYSGPNVINCTFIGNSSFVESPVQAKGGGIYNNYYSNATVANCTFTGNSSEWGGGVCNSSSNPTITNCILWGDWASLDGNEIRNVSSSPVVTYCDVQGSWSGTGNINLDPYFVNSSTGNLRLLSNSPCIDKGNNTGVPADIADLDGDSNTTEPTPLDLDLRLRFVDGDCNGAIVVDMGAYEFGYAGDFDCDHDVEFIDYAILANSWLQNDPLRDIAPPPAGDGIVDIKDLAVLCDNWLAGK
ncbi:MAG: right-handed parallel beta-helix repeat-containing protein [Sedimentisphaerales bacterium]